MSLQEEELVSSHAGQPEQESSLLDQIMAQTRIQPGSADAVDCRMLAIKAVTPWRAT
ncbi:hypothetical protein ACIJER_004186, partial [Escherichia coli]